MLKEQYNFILPYLVVLLLILLFTMSIFSNDDFYRIQKLLISYKMNNTIFGSIDNKFKLTIMDRFDKKWVGQRKAITLNTGKCGYVFPNKMVPGRTGDQMVEFAGNFLLAKDTDRQLIVSTDQLNGRAFSRLQGFRLLPSIANHSRSTAELRKNAVHIMNKKDFLPVKCGDNITISAAYGASHYFTMHKNKENINVSSLVQDLFHFKPKILKKCRRTLQDGLVESGCSNCSCNLITAHIRRTDYAHKITNLNNQRRAISVYYIQQAYRYIEREFQRSGSTCSVLVILSDDYKWSKDNAPIGSHVYVVPKSQDPLVDLCIMSSADAVITTIGNFGYMGAYLSGGLVTYQSNQRRMYRPLTSWIPIDPCPPTMSKEELEASSECAPPLNTFNHEEQINRQRLHEIL